MFRIDGPGAVGELPPVREGVSAPGFFGPGNPATGQMSTRVTYEWLNAVQEELVQVIRHAGIEPNKEDNAQLLKALKTIISDSRAEAWRKSMIGAAVMLPSPVLPDGYMWPDGTLASFEDWPELEEAYKAGKFEGYVLPASATDEDKAVWPGKWVLAADSAGLYTPRLIGLFARYCSTEGAGAYNKPGLPNITGNWSNFNLFRPASNVSNYTGAFSANATTSVPTQGGVYWGWDGLSFNASRSSAIYGASATVTPESANLPAALYLGKPAEV